MEIPKKHKKKIGILGGMGAPATIRWYETIVKMMQSKYGAIQDNDYPEMYIFNLSLDGWTEKGIENEELVKKQIIHALKGMESLNPSVIIICCNTIHHFYKELQSITSIKIVSIIDNCRANTKGELGILCSSTTNQLKLYGEDCIYLNENDQKEVDEVILRCQCNKQSQSDTLVLLRHRDTLLKSGANAVILGCTELPLCFDVVLPPFVDAGYLLLDKITDSIYE